MFGLAIVAAVNADVSHLLKTNGYPSNHHAGYNSHSNDHAGYNYPGTNLNDQSGYNHPKPSTNFDDHSSSSPYPAAQSLPAPAVSIKQNHRKLIPFIHFRFYLVHLVKKNLEWIITNQVILILPF